MKLGIGALAAGNPTGLGRLCRAALIGLACSAGDEELHVFVRSAADLEQVRGEATPELRAALGRLNYHVGRLPRIPVLQRHWLEQHWIPALCREIGIDAYLGCDFTLPESLNIPRRFVILPDLLPLSRPETVSLTARMLYGRAIRHAVRSQAGFFCISDATRRALVERFPGTAERSITVLPPLSPLLWTYASRGDSLDLALQVQGSLHSYVSKRPYILAVGVRGPRKNTPLLVQAYTELVLSGDYHGSLVLTGGDGSLHAANTEPRLAVVALGQQPAREEEAPAVHDIGRVNEFDLSRLYRNADLLVNLSSEEGFGYPVLEALAHGTPALVSRGSSMVEIAAGGIAETSLEPAEVRVKLLSTLNALPLLRREAAGLDLQKYSAAAYGARILELIGAVETETT